MRDQISELSKKFIQKFLTDVDVFELLEEDIAKKDLIDFCKHYEKNDLPIPIDDVYKFICEKKDLTDKGVNLILNDDVKLFLRIRNHEETGTWYSDDYTPYCGQRQVKCSGPRMDRTDYGNKCPECKNEIGLSGLRLTDSPLNIDSNKITIDPNEILKYPDRSVTDPEMIRQIALWGIKNNSNILDCKVSQMMEYAGLYPHIQKPINLEEVKNNPEMSELIEKLREDRHETGKPMFMWKKDTWIKFEEFFTKPKNEIINFRVDTRDFHIIDASNFTKFVEYVTPHMLTIINKYPGRFDYSFEEMKNCLTKSKADSGGDVEWRMLNYEKYPNETGGWELKYLTIIKIDNDKYVILDDKKERLLKKEMWNTPIDIGLLCAH